MAEVDFKKIEKKWQDSWEREKVFETKEIFQKKKNYYALEMFPYPSGSGLHIGHAWNFLIGDILARFKRLEGFNVLHPMGYDSLGLPAENAAIKVGTHPKEYTDKSIKNFIRQQKAIGLSYDWTRMISSADPNYYKWDQWIFLKMFEKGLAYKKESNVNWCPSCKTVLANEQAQTGNCDRCGTKVLVKNLNQWFLKITKYADELYEDINKLKYWPDKTKAMQRNWIGKSHGIEINFRINGEEWPIFTTRPDTIFGVTFMVVSAQHRNLWDLVKDSEKKKVESFLQKLKSVSEKDLAEMEKEGVFTGAYAKH
jgi:leucyl-tRNA synthetase